MAGLNNPLICVYQLLFTYSACCAQSFLISIVLMMMMFNLNCRSLFTASAELLHKMRNISGSQVLCKLFVIKVGDEQRQYIHNVERNELSLSISINTINLSFIERIRHRLV